MSHPGGFIEEQEPATPQLPGAKQEELSIINQLSIPKLKIL